MKAGFYRLVNGIANLFRSEDKYIPKSSTEFTSDLVREDLSDIDLKWYDFSEGKWKDADIFGNSLGQVFYDASTTVGNMAPGMLVSATTGLAGAPVLGKIAGSLTMGGSAAGNAYQEKLNQGYDKKTARAYSLMIGASEVVLEKFLGGISKLGGGNLTNAAINNLDKVDNVLARFATSTGGKLLMNAGSEALEEGLQSILEPYLWEAVSGQTARVDWEEALYSSLMGFATGGLMEGVDMVIYPAAQSVHQPNTGKTPMPTDVSADAQINPINEVEISSGKMENTLPNQINKVNQKTTDSEVVQPSETIQATNNQTNVAINPEDVANSLRNQGVSSKKANGIADAVTARLNGQELTRPQRNILRSALDSPTVQSVISEFIQKKTDGLDSAKSKVYDKNAVADVAENGEGAALWDLAYQRAGIDIPGAPVALQENGNLPAETHPSTQQRNLKSERDSFGDNADATETEDATPNQVQGTAAEESYEDDPSSARILGNGQSLKDMAELYAEIVHSNRKWGWLDEFPDAEMLSQDNRTDIKKYAIERGLIPNVLVNTVTGADGKIYRYADFDGAGLVKEKVHLPEYLWFESDAVQFEWLDDKIGGRPKGYTWHHSEVDGQMELVPTGVHRVYHHNGGRTINHWAYREGGR